MNGFNSWEALQRMFQSLPEDTLKKLNVHIGVAEKSKAGQIKVAEMEAKSQVEQNQQMNKQMAGGSVPMNPWQGMATSQDVLNMNRQFRM